MSEITTYKYKDLAENKSGFDNPREKFDLNRIKELAADIKAQGLLYPLQVWPTEYEGKGVNVVVDGERRRRAIALLIDSGDWPEGRGIDCRIIDAKTQKDAQYVALSGNIQREELSSYETARAMTQLKVMGDSQQAIAERLNKSETWVSRKLKAYDAASPGLRRAWKNGQLPDDTVEDLAKLHCGNFGADDHEDDCDDCRDVQEAEVDLQLDLRAKEKGAAGKTKAKKRAKKRAKKLQRASLKELQGLLLYAEKAPKDNRYSRGLYDGLRFAIGTLEEDGFHSEFKSFRKELEKKLEADEAGLANGEGKKGKGKEERASA
jgi:ParB/RepB/Spo0J family partition protein